MRDVVTRRREYVSSATRLDADVGWRVDPNCFCERRDARHAADESFGVLTKRATQDVLAKSEHVVGVTEVHVGWRELGECAVVMLVVGPTEEGSGVIEPFVVAAVEAIGKSRSVLERLEVALDEGVVVGRVRSAERFLDAEVREHLRNRLADHRWSAIGVDREFAFVDRVLAAGLADQLARELGALAARQHPADGVATEDVEDDVEMEVVPFLGTEELGDVPRPDLVGSDREQLRFDVLRMPSLISALTHLVFASEDAVHRAKRAEVRAFVEN